MRIRVIFTTVLIFLLNWNVPLSASDFNKVGSSAAQFLKIESGSRAVALGSAYAAIADDPFAIYWNVAGIAQMKNISGGITYTNWIADLQHSFSAIVIPAGGLGNVGLSVTTLSSGKIEQTTIENPHGTGTFVEASDIALGVSYARNMTNFVSVGMTVKYVRQNLWDLSAQALAMDIGFLLDTGFRGIKMGMTLSNFGTELRMTGDNLIRAYDKWPENNADPNVQTALETTTWPLPTSYRVSVAADLVGGEASSLFSDSERHRLIAVIDALHPNDNPEHYSGGIEYTFNKMLALRSGYTGGTDERGMTFGAGLQTPLGGQATIILDYAYADFGVFDYIQQVSVRFAF